MANFTPQEIEEILQQFFDVTGKRQYIGARYVPIIGRKGEDTIEWDNSAPYEPLTIVLYQGNSYTSRTYIPAGIDISDAHYWAPTGNYNAQVELYRQETAVAKQLAEDVQDELGNRIIGFNTVADMIASDSIYSGAICHTNSYRNGGGAYYIISDNAVPNGMDVIACGDLFATIIPIDTVSPNQFGAYADGTHDDATAIQHAIDYSKANDLKFTIEPKTYGIGEQITLLNPIEGNDNLFLDFNGATFVALENMSQMVLSDTGDFSTDINRSKRVVSNLVLDCNEKASRGIYHKWGRNFNYNHVSIFNCRECAFYADGQVFINGMFIDRRMYNYSDTIGIQLNMSDNKLSNIRIRDSKRAFIVNGGSSFLINCHAWLINPVVIPDSVCFELIAGHTYIIGSYADTYETSFKCVSTTNQFIVGTKIFINPDFYNDDVDENQPIAFEVQSSTAYNELKIVGFEIDAYNYRLATGKKALFSNIEITETQNTNYVTVNKALEAANIDNRPNTYVDNVDFERYKNAIAAPTRNYAADSWSRSLTPSQGTGTNITIANNGFVYILSGRLTVDAETSGVILTGLPIPEHEVYVMFVDSRAANHDQFKMLLSLAGNLGTFGGTTLPAGTYLFYCVYISKD